MLPTRMNAYLSILDRACTDELDAEMEIFLKTLMLIPEALYRASRID